MAQHKKATTKPKVSSPEKSHLPYILLVEDEPTHVTIVRHTIQSANPNAVVKVAGSLKEYRRAIENSLPEIALIDMHLPDGKALEVLISPLEDGSFPVVVMTSSGDDKIAVKAMKAGALDYIVKSTETFKAIPHTIDRALREWKLIQERKLAERELRESEQRFRSLYENVAIGLYRTTPAGKILMANQALVKMLSYASFEQLAERNLAKTGFAQSSLRRVFLRKIEMEGEVNNFESTWIRQDRSLIIVQESARAIRDSQGKTLYYDGTVEDITERRLAEAASRYAEDALRESNEKYHDLFINTALGIFHSTFDGKFIDMNPALARSLGYDSPEEAANSITNISEQVYTEPSRRDSVSTDVLKTGGMISVENHYRRKDGTTWDGMLHVRIVRDRQGKPSHYEGFVEDITERKQAEEVLTLFRHTFNCINESIGIADPEDKILFVNKAFSNTYGYSEKELIGKPMSIVSVSNDNVLQKTLSGGWRGEVLNRKKDGTVFPVFLSTSVVYNEKKQPIAFVGASVDITDRKQAEEALRESEEKYREFVERANDGIGIAQDAILQYVNPRLAEMIGYSVEELIGSPFANFFISEEIPKVVDRHKRRMAGEDFAPIYETALRHRDGGRIDIEVNAGIVTYKGKLANLVLVRNITERKRAEVLLKVSETRYRLLADHMKDTIWLMDMDLKTTYISPSVEKLRGYTLKELQQLPLEKQFTPASFKLAMDAFSEEMQKVMADPTYFISRTLELEFYRKDGTTYWSENRFSLIRDENGNPESIMGEGRDITERKRAEEALQESEKILTEAQKVAHLGWFEWIVDQNIIRWSEEEKRIYGIPLDDPTPTLDQVTAFFHPDDRSETWETIRKALIGEARYEFEMRIIRPDGSIRNLYNRAEVYRDSNGKALRVLGTTLDITDRKRAEEELRKSHERLHLALESANSGTWEWDLLTNENIWSDELWKLYGLEPHSCVASYEVWRESIYADDREKTEKKVQEAVREGKELNAEWRVIGRDGVVRWLMSRGRPSQDANGKVIRFNGIVVDITERKRAEEALRESEERYNALFDRSLDLVYICDFEGNFIDANDAALNLLGYKKEEISSLNFSSLLSEDQLPLAFKVTQEIKKTGIHRDLVEFRLRCKNGEEVYVESKGSAIISDGKTVAFQSIARDITERKQAEEKLTLISSRQEAILSAVPNIIMEVSNNKVYTWANQSGIDFFGDDVIGKEASFYFEGEQETYKIVEPLFNGFENIIYLESWQRRKDGEKRLLAWWCRVLKDKSGNVTGALSSARDITDQKRSEEAVRQMQKMEGLGTLAGGIAHDFNNILGIILAYVTSIMRFKDDAKKLDLATETITKTVHRGKTLVQQILTFARKSATEFGAVNVNDVVMEIMTMIFETFPKVLTYAQNIDKAIPHINADRSQLHQALLNLCVNARDAMPNGGVLTINTRMVSVASLRTQHPDAAVSSYVCIEVSDTGEGMTEEIRKRIFEPFFTTKGIGKGTGLGLAVVFGIVQTHKGFVDVESELGKGTTFRLYLPVSQVVEPISIIEDEETLEEIQGGTETLLVVEDEEMLMMSLQMVLVEKGYTVLSAGDGLEALKIYQERKNDIALVLTDLGLPTMTGLEVCQRIKTINPKEPMILATGFLDPEMKSEFLKAGIQYFLYKPYDLKKVLKVVREVLDKKELK